jgi:hypothetical protein
VLDEFLCFFGFGACSCPLAGRLFFFFPGFFGPLFTHAPWDAIKHSTHDPLSAIELASSKPFCAANFCKTALHVGMRSVLVNPSETLWADGAQRILAKIPYSAKVL